MVIRLLSLRAVCALTSLSRTTVYRLQDAGAFPRSVKVSPGRIAFIESEVEGYIKSRIAQRITV